MAFKLFKTNLEHFPIKHLLSIFLGALLFLFLFLASYLELEVENPSSSLKSSLAIESLVNTEDLTENLDYLSKEIEIKKNDSLYSILEKAGVYKKNIVEITNSKNSNLLSNIKVGDKIKLVVNSNNRVMALKYMDDYKSGVEAILKDNKYSIYPYVSKIEKVRIYKQVVIEGSMYGSGLRDSVPDSVIMDLAYINGWDIDFIHDIRPGDSYSLIYEEILVDGEKKLNGDILIAEFINQGKKYISIRYSLKNGKSEYFSPEGINVKKAFLRSPVDFSYISSRYNLKRKHPILHTIRSHNGVDYAANRGSPIRATGDGTVSFSGTKNGCGKEVEIKHSQDYSTRYCHLERFGLKIATGRKVKQGQTIGYVGSTGLATGPHLHYEFHVNGKHTDPLKVKFPNVQPIDKTEEEKYLLHSDSLISSLRNYQDITESKDQSDA